MLKTIGASGLAVASVPTVTATELDYTFIASLDVPMLFKENNSGEHVPVNDDDVTIDGHWPVDGAVILGDSYSLDCGFFGISCDGWSGEIPLTMSWTTDAPVSFIRELEVSVGAERVWSNNDGYSSAGPVYQSGGTGEVFDDGRNISVQMSSDNDIGPVYIPVDFNFSVHFRNSDLWDGEMFRKSITVGVPSNSLEDRSANMLDAADTIWEESVGLADEFVRAPLEDLETATKMWAYAATSDMVDGSDIPENAVVDGISAFKEPLEDEVESYNDYLVTPAGPTIIASI